MEPADAIIIVIQAVLEEGLTETTAPMMNHIKTKVLALRQAALAALAVMVTDMEIQADSVQVPQSITSKDVIQEEVVVEMETIIAVQVEAVDQAGHSPIRA